MELVEDKHSNDLDIKKYSNKTIFISDMTYTEPIVIHQNSISIFNISDPLLITIDELKNYLEKYKNYPDNKSKLGGFVNYLRESYKKKVLSS